MKKVTFHSLSLEELKNNLISQQADDSLYFFQYQHMLSFAKSVDEFCEARFTQLALMTYGWMPTMLKKVDINHIERSIQIINKLKCDTEYRQNISTKDLDTLKSCTNNSYVGLSKLLHMVMPEHFPIWDSRVANALECSNYDLARNSGKYTAYIDMMRNRIEHENLERLHYIVQDKHGFKISKLRALEYSLFCYNQK